MKLSFPYIVALFVTSSVTSSSGQVPALRGASIHRILEPKTDTDTDDFDSDDWSFEECVLYRKSIQWEDETSDESWSCNFDGNGPMLNINGISTKTIDSHQPISGGSILKIQVNKKSTSPIGSKLMVSTKGDDKSLGTNDNMELVIASNQQFEISNLAENDVRHYKARRKKRRNRRKLTAAQAPPSSTGTLEVLVVRVGANNGAIQVISDESKLINDVFEDAVSLRSQYAACSKDQLLIVPASEGTSINPLTGEPSGIVDVNIASSPCEDCIIDNNGNGISNFEILEAEAFSAANQTYGDLSTTFDLVMFCQPGGSGTWVAYAYTNYFHSYYNNHFCSSVSAQMHELGHNFGLRHSNEGSQAYGDITGMMGFSYDSDDGPQKCFNAAKSWQLGWYEQQSTTYDPADFMTAGMDDITTYIMNGINEYDKEDGANSDKTILVRLVYNSNKHFYIGYNRSSGPNVGTSEDGDKIVIIQTIGNPTSYGESFKVATLSMGDDYVLKSVHNSANWDVTIRFESRSDDLDDAIITVSTVSQPNNYCRTTDKYNIFDLEITTDNYPSETSWTLTNVLDGIVVAEGSDYTSTNTNHIVAPITLEEGTTYEFAIFDSYGDGICCKNGDGAYTGQLDGEEIFNGSYFAGYEATKFLTCTPSPFVYPYYLADGCSANDPAKLDPEFGVPRTPDESDLNSASGEIQCCSEDGDSCRRHNLSGQCLSGTAHTNHPFDPVKVGDAESMCHSLGMRLCRTQDEVDMCCGTGCQYDNALVWMMDITTVIEEMSSAFAGIKWHGWN